MNAQPYEVFAEETRATVYRFGEPHSVYDLVSEAHEECDRLNRDFLAKADALHRAFTAYGNSPRGWTWEARIDAAVTILEEFLSDSDRLTNEREPLI